MARSFSVFTFLVLALIGGGAFAAEGETAPPTPPPAPPPSAVTPAPAPGLLERQSFPRPSVLFAFRFLHPRAIDIMARDLNLNDTQKAQVTELVQKLEQSSKPKLEAQHKAADEFATAMTDPSTTEAALKAAADKVFKAESELVAENIKTLCAIRALLTEEQAPALKRFLEQRTMPYRTLMQGAPPAAAPAPQPAPAPAN